VYATGSATGFSARSAAVDQPRTRGNCPTAVHANNPKVHTQPTALSTPAPTSIRTPLTGGSSRASGRPGPGAAGLARRG
jgi:hypothetical protein